MFKNYLNLTKCLLAEFQFFDGLFTFPTKLNAREKLAGNSKKHFEHIFHQDPRDGYCSKPGCSVVFTTFIARLLSFVMRKVILQKAIMSSE